MMLYMDYVVLRSTLVMTMMFKNIYDIKEFIKVNTTLLFIFKTTLK